MSLLNRLGKRLGKGLGQARRVARRVIDELPIEETIRAAKEALGRSGSPAASPGARRGPAPPPEPEPESTITDVVDTADRALLVGLTGLKMALEPHGKPMLVNHWATWCTGCVDELPLLVALRERWRGKADFLGVGWEGFSGDSSPQKLISDVERVSAEQGVDWATLVFEGQPEALWEALGLENHQIPQTLVLHPDGSVMVHHLGVLDTAAINRIEAALRQAGIAH